MGRYTDELEDFSYQIHPDDEDYTERLIEVVGTFREFDAAMDDFLISRGYSGACSDLESKLAFLRDAFRSAGVPVPRNMKRWFTEHKRIERVTALAVCFAFRLNLEETEDFFRRICLTRGLDCHDIREAVCYFCIRNGMSYVQTEELLARVPKVKQGKLDAGRKVLYTSAIVQEIERMSGPEELIRYIEDNRDQFEYNHATAQRMIKKIWEEIAKAGGLAEREVRELGCLENELTGTEAGKRSSTDAESGGYTRRRQESERIGEKAGRRSVWEIYRQILGYDEEQSREYKKERSFKSLLRDNRLLHPLAETAFPDREGIEKILNGAHVSHETVRKTLILLLFYRFWVSAALVRGDAAYLAKQGEAERAHADINRYLTEAGYPTLYHGNPYDWIFLFAIQDDAPLALFREFMQEIYIIQREREARNNPQNQTGKSYN